MYPMQQQTSQPMPPVPLMQPMPWMAPQQPMPAGPWMAPLQPMQPAWEAAPGPPAQQPGPMVPLQSAPPPQAGPQNRYIYSFLPDNEMCCLQGPKQYLASALARLRESPMAKHYATSQVTLGMCANRSYVNGPFPATCFPRAALYTDDDPMHVMAMIDLDRSETRLRARGRGVPAGTALAEMRSACDDGSMDEGLQLSMEESRAQVYVQPMASLIPDNNMACIQGHMAYLKQVLERVKESPVAPIFQNTQSPVNGMCSEYGYTIGSGGVVASGHGRIKNKCFPKATIFWDTNRTHHDLLLWYEGRVTKGTNTNFNWTRYEERREEVRDMCNGRAETVYTPLPPNLK